MKARALWQTYINMFLCSHYNRVQVERAHGFLLSSGLAHQIAHLFALLLASQVSPKLQE